VSAADAKLIEQIQQATQGASRLLCTLARRGKMMERDEPQRAAFLLAAVRTHSLYKGGRLAFDMLEIEDIMLDGSSREPMSTPELIQVLGAGAHRLAETLVRIGSRKAEGPATTEKAGFDLEVGTGTVGRDPRDGTDESSTTRLPRVRLGPGDGVRATVADASAGEDEGRDPKQLELQASDYLYDFVVLGFLDLLAGTDAFRPTVS
jgi:hypothetical protein